jgi:hypothetical protein
MPRKTCWDSPTLSGFCDAIIHRKWELVGSFFIEVDTDIFLTSMKQIERPENSLAAGAAEQNHQ